MNRSFLCVRCGNIKRAQEGSTPPCQFCGTEMKKMSHEQAAAAVHLPASERGRWYLTGGLVKRGAGRKKRWTAV